jgi:hypothetical protein
MGRRLTWQEEGGRAVESIKCRLVHAPGHVNVKSEKPNTFDLLLLFIIASKDGSPLLSICVSLLLDGRVHCHSPSPWTLSASPSS